MTNLTTILSIVLVTNWTCIGTFTDKAYKYFNVQEGRLCTNDVLTVTFDGGGSNQFVLRSWDGPVIGERKVLIQNPITYATNYMVPGITNIWRQGIILNGTSCDFTNSSDPEAQRNLLREYNRRQNETPHLLPR